MHFSSRKDFYFANGLPPDGSYDLPKTIHFIWIGKPIEEKYIRNIQTFVINKDYKVHE